MILLLFAMILVILTPLFDFALTLHYDIRAQSDMDAKLANISEAIAQQIDFIDQEERQLSALRKLCGSGPWTQAGLLTLAAAILAKEKMHFAAIHSEVAAAAPAQGYFLQPTRKISLGACALPGPLLWPTPSQSIVQIQAEQAGIKMHRKVAGGVEWLYRNSEVRPL